MDGNVNSSLGLVFIKYLGDFLYRFIMACVSRLVLISDGSLSEERDYLLPG